MNIDERLVAEAIAERLVADPEARVELIRAQGGGRYLTVGQVAEKLGVSKKRVVELPIPQRELPGERGRSWYEPEVDAWMESRRVGGVA